MFCGQARRAGAPHRHAFAFAFVADVDPDPDPKRVEWNEDGLRDAKKGNTVKREPNGSEMKGVGSG